jgi:hypothetical protein
MFLWIILIVSLLLNAGLLLFLIISFSYTKRAAINLFRALQQRKTPAYETSLKKLLAEVDQLAGRDATPEAWIRAASHLVHTSSHGGEVERDAFNTVQVIQQLSAVVDGDADPLTLSCGPRTLVLLHLCWTKGYPARVIEVFSPVREALFSHIFLEVLNPSTGRWEAYDPSYDAVYLDEGGRRLATFELVFGDLGRVHPLRYDGENTWEGARMVKVRDNYLRAFVYDNRLTGQPTVAFINQDRFPPDRRFPKSGGITLADYLRRTQLEVQIVIQGEVIPRRESEN